MTTGLQVVDVETARDARGLRLVILADVPSPWSLAAKTILEVKQIPALIVRKSVRDQAVQAWTGIPNAPIAIYENEPPRSGWAEILELTERLKPEVPLVPRDPEQRVRMYGLSHELLGAGGLIWSARLFTLDASLASDGAKGFSLPVAKYLAARYGYAPGCSDAARARAIEILGLLRDQLQKSRRAGYDYYLGNAPTALDIYSATVFNALAMLPPDQCPAHPAMRAAFEWMGAELRDAIAPELLAHRDQMVAKHFSLPLQL
jgi:glutathione S-transferase